MGLVRQGGFPTDSVDGNYSSLMLLYHEFCYICQLESWALIGARIGAAFLSCH